MTAVCSVLCFILVKHIFYYTDKVMTSSLAAVSIVTMVMVMTCDVKGTINDRHGIAMFEGKNLQ